MPRRPDRPPREKPFDPQTCRMELFRWWVQALNQISWIQDRLDRESGYATAFTESERRQLATALDRAWHEMGFITCGWLKPCDSNPVPEGRGS